ncbi:hypothetical protein AAEO56_01820 [Flavobacterium sp. DGU11]|uniref:STAS domain-containing protein n=1 Tax=Flavobacterium arundinis TaxID=3139143 RepID=A0ABU9HS34_9FLAO
MLIKFEEQIIDNYLIPEFTLSAGEIVVINLHGHFYDLIKKLNDLLASKVTSNKVQITVPLTYAPHIKFNRFWHFLFPMTVGKWINRHADKSNPIYKKIYENDDWLTSKTNIDNLAGSPRRFLSVCCTLSKTNTIIFDLAGVDPVGGKQIYELVKAEVEKGGAAILYDICNEFRNDCTTYLEAKPTMIRAI